MEQINHEAHRRNERTQYEGDDTGPPYIVGPYRERVSLLSVILKGPRLHGGRHAPFQPAANRLFGGRAIDRDGL